MAFARSSMNVEKPPLNRSFSMPSELSCEGGPEPIRSVDDGSKDRIKGRLEIEEKLEDIIILENDTALFECKVVQNLKPTSSWHKDGITLQTDDERISVIKNSSWHRLKIKHVKFSDQGIYSIEFRHNGQYLSVKGHLYVAPRQLNDGVFYHKTVYTGPEVIKHLINVKVTEGENIELEAKFRYVSVKYAWYKNTSIVLKDQRITMCHYETSASITISNAKPTDTGIYYVVAKTEAGYQSSVAEVIVGEINEKLPVFPILEEHLPEDIEVFVGEELRMVIKAHVDKNTIIRWEKDGEPINTSHVFDIDYGNNYYGVIIPNSVKHSAGEYEVTLLNRELKREVTSSTRVTINQVLPKYPKVDLLRPLVSAVACCGAKVTFDCRYDLQDPIYYYVVWYVGHYKVERTNTHFNVICNGGQFLLYIKNLEPSMAGEVVCELRRALPNRKSVMINRAYARLVIVPLPVIQEVKTRPTINGKLYYEQDANHVNIRIEDIEDSDMRYQTDFDDADCLLKIVYCRLDDDGLYFVNVERGVLTGWNIRLKVYESPYTNNKTVILEWDTAPISKDSWYVIELGQTNGSFSKVGCSSRPRFWVENPPIDRLMIFRIRAVAINPKSLVYESEVYIVPPPEIILREPIPHDIQPMDSFDARYTKTNELIGTGAFGSVSLVKDEDGAYYAAKFVKARIEMKRDNILKEFHIMKDLCHPKLIELIGFYESKTTFVFVMEYCWGGELFDRVVGEEFLKEVDVVGYVKQICEGLKYIHQKDIVHLDLKPENIICMNPNSRQVKLIDFGLARNLNEGNTRAVYGTRDYVAPEVIDYEPITTATDMWSLGVVTYALLSGVMPFIGKTWVERSINITGARYDYDDSAFAEVSDLAKNFVDHLLVRNPSKRISATKALQHEWILGGPRGMKPKRMNTMRQNLKSYLADYRSRWQRAGNVVIAAHRLRMMRQPASVSEQPPEATSTEYTLDVHSSTGSPDLQLDIEPPELIP